MKKGLTDVFVLSNGVQIPCVGFGTWQTPDGETAENAIKTAVQCGYRHIDTAAAYDNEPSIGKAIQECGVKREELFITSKLWNEHRGYQSTLDAFEKTMQDLRLEYLDLYLIHWPAAKGPEEEWQKINAETWKAFEKLYRDGRIRAIGLSNFLPRHLEPLLATAEIVPMVNQIEFHPGQMQQETVDFCRKHKILIEAWSPLGTGRMLKNPDLLKIAEKYHKSVAQLCIRWCLQNEVLPLPKSVTASRIAENTQVFDFVISQEDMQRINRMEYFGGSGLHPDTVDF